MPLTALRQIPVLASMSNDDLESLRGHFQWVWHQPGEMVVRQGQAAHDFFLVAMGQVELLLEGDMPTRLGLLGPGEFFGELPALTGEPAPATAVARETVSLVRFTPEGLLHLLDRSRELNRQIIATLAGRVKEAGTRLHRARLRERSLSDHLAKQGARTYQEWVGSGPWSQRIRAAMARGSRSAEPVLFLGEAGTGKELAAARLHYNSERKAGAFIVLDMSGFTPERWRESLRLAAHGSLLLKNVDRAPREAVTLISQALPGVMTGRRGELPNRVPRILATAPPSDEREPSAAESVLLREGYAVPIPPLRERREDIPALARHFIRKHGGRPEDAAGPITPEALRRLENYPYLAGNVRELERVMAEALLLAGGGPIATEHLRLKRHHAAGRPRVGLALGGGVVRGCAHIGVIRALEEAGIPIDYVAGASSGALIGALYAGGLDWLQMQSLLPTMGWFDLAEPTWPRGGFLTSRRMRAFLDRQIGPAEFLGLRMPLAVVAGDANTGQEVILRDGLVADAVRASTAIPGIFLPGEVDGRLLVDGVVVNNVPASVVRAMGADIVIAVDVTQYGFAAGAPRSFGDAVMRAFDIMARQTINASLEWADLVIRPDVSGVSGLSFKSGPEIVRRGYQAAQAAVPDLLARLEEAGKEMAV